MDDLPLTGLNVVEMHAIGPVPFVGLQLQTMGATVVRVSPPHVRDIGIAMDASADLLNHGKSVRTIDLKHPDGASQLKALLRTTDVLLEGFRPGVMERLGLAPDTLCRDFPQLVTGRLSGFGRQGDLAPRAGHDINYLALSGALAAIGTREQPVIPLNLVADFGGGAMHLLAGVLASLVKRSINGRGGIVDTSILAGTLGLTGMTHGLLANGQWSLQRQDNLLDGGAPFYGVYATADGRHIAIGALEAPFYQQLLELTGLQSELSTDEQYDRRTWPAMRTHFQRVFAQRTRDQWAEAALHCDCCLTPVLNFEESTTHPHTIANGWILTDPFPHPGPVLQFTASTP